jgi:hypothetical protein
MTGDESVIPGLARLREAGESLKLSEGRKGLPASCQDFMRIALMANVENESVPRGVIYAVNGDGQLHRSEIGGKVPARLGDAVDLKAAKLFA